MSPPVTVSIERHQSRFWQRFDSCDFARNLCDVPLVLAEIMPAASTFPIILREKDGVLLPHALLGADPAQSSAFVTQEGQWRSHYLPAFLRTHPFSAASIGDSAKFELQVSEDSGHVTDDIRDERFFDLDGTPSAALQEVIVFLRQYAGSRQRTIEATELLRHANVLRPFKASCVATEWHQDSWKVDTKALESLDGATLHRLMQAGTLQLAHAMTVSLGLINLLAQASATHGKAWTSGHTQEVDIAHNFLSTLAEAHENDKEDLFLPQKGL